MAQPHIQHTRVHVTHTHILEYDILHHRTCYSNTTHSYNTFIQHKYNTFIQHIYTYTAGWGDSSLPLFYLGGGGEKDEGLPDVQHDPDDGADKDGRVVDVDGHVLAVTRRPHVARVVEKVPVCVWRTEKRGVWLGVGLH